MVTVRGMTALEFLYGKHLQSPLSCYTFPFNQERVYYISKQRTPQWIALQMKQGDPEIGDVPVRTCSTHGCVNGEHYKWGSQAEANRTRRKVSFDGEDNPGAKVTALEVAQLRSVKWGGGYFKRHAAEASGISMRTMALILNGGTWKGIMPYKGAAEWASRGKEDEF